MSAGTRVNSPLGGIPFLCQGADQCYRPVHDHSGLSVVALLVALLVVVEVILVITLEEGRDSRLSLVLSFSSVVEKTTSKANTT